MKRKYSHDPNAEFPARIPEDLEELPEWRMGDCAKLLGLVQSADKAPDRLNFLSVCAEVDDMYDRKPPDDANALAMDGLAWTNNVDWGGMEFGIDDAIRPEFALMHDPEVYVRIASNYNGPGAAYMRTKVEREDALMLDSWEEWIPESGKMLLQRKKYGMGILYFRHPRSWQCQALHPGNLLTSSKSINPGRWEWAAIHTEFDMTDLLRKLSKKQKSEDDEYDGFGKDGWHQGNIRKAIQSYQKENSSLSKILHRDAEEWRSEVLANDLHYSKDLAITGYIVYVKEFDGKVTEYLICDREDIGFLYRSPKAQRLRQMSSAFIMFPGQVGQNLFREIRGYGIKNLPLFDAENNNLNRALDQNWIANSTLLEGGSSDDLYRQSEMVVGAFTMLPPGLQIAANQFPDTTDKLLAVAEYFQRRRDGVKGVTGGGMGGEQAPDRESAKAATFRQHNNQQGQSYNAAFFKLACKKFHRERFRRYMGGTMVESDLGHEEAQKVKVKLLGMGVSQEFLDSLDLDATEAATIFGDGDAANLFASLMEMLPFVPSMTAEGRAAFYHDLANAKVGVERSRTYFGDMLPDPTEQRNKVQAQLENGHFESSDARLDVGGDDNHLVHLNEHVGFLEAKAQAMQEGQLSPEEFYKTLSRALPHLGLNADGQPEGGHIAPLLQDQTLLGLSEGLIQRLMPLVNLRRQVEQQLQAQQQAEQEQQIQEMQMPLEEQAKAAKVQSEMLIAEQKAALEIQKLRAEIEHMKAKARLEIEILESKMAIDAIERTTNTQAA